MAKTRSTESLRRYTDLPALLHLLKHRKITLLDPSTWDDTNDSYYLLKYKERKGLKTVLALCLPYLRLLENILDGHGRYQKLSIANPQSFHACRLGCVDRHPQT